MQERHPNLHTGIATLAGPLSRPEPEEEPVGSTEVFKAQNREQRREQGERGGYTTAWPWLHRGRPRLK